MVKTLEKILRGERENFIVAHIIEIFNKIRRREKEEWRRLKGNL